MVTALTLNYRSISINKLYSVIVEDFSMVLSGSEKAATGTLCRYGISILYPIGDIDIVNMLFIDVIAAKPVEIIPVTHLVFHFSLASHTWPDPNTTAVPIYLSGYYISGDTVFNAFYGL